MRRRLTLVPPKVPPAQEYVPPGDLYRDYERETMHDARDMQCRRCYGVLLPGQEVMFLRTDVRTYHAHINCPEEDHD